MTSELSLRDYLEMVRRRAWVLVVALVGALVLAFLASALQTSQYRSSSRILINQNTTNAIFDPVTGVQTNAAERAATNEVELLRSQLVRTAAEERLGFSADISARAEVRADIVVVSAVDTSPQRAQLVAQTYAEAYLDVRRSEFVTERLATAEKLLDRIQELEAEITQAGAEVDTFRQQQLRDDLADSYDRLTITADLGNNGSARIIDDAQVPETPFTPRTTRNMLLGGVVGLLLGAGGALLVESLDRSIKTRSVIEQLLPTTPTLALVPSMKSEHDVVTLAQPEGVESEVFRTLRAGIEFAALDRAAQVIQVTSPGPSAGKTTVAANLAVVMAKAGQNVAVVDADLRRPRLHAAFGLDQVPGISSVIIGREQPANVAHSLDLNNGRLWVFPSGPIPPGPSELLGSERAFKTFAALRKTLDVIIVDSPPVLPVADALIMSRLADVTLLVANARSTRRDDLVRAAAQLEHAGANVVGTVLNQVKTRGLAHGYGYGYGYGYGEATPPVRFGRNKNKAPRLEGTAMFSSSELPRFRSARTLDFDVADHPNTEPGQHSPTTDAGAPTPVDKAIAPAAFDSDVAGPPTAAAKSTAGASQTTKPKKAKSASKTAKGSTQRNAARPPRPRKRRTYTEEELEGWGDDVIVKS